MLIWVCNAKLIALSACVCVRVCSGPQESLLFIGIFLCKKNIALGICFCDCRLCRSSMVSEEDLFPFSAQGYYTTANSTA